LIPDGFEEFNYHRLEGKDLTTELLAETIEAMPMMTERTLTVVTDYDLFGCREEERKRVMDILEDLPEYCCLVFVYDTVPYKPNRTMKKLCQLLDEHVEIVEFRAQSSSDLCNWIARRFRALGKDIDRQNAEYLIFLCGDLMTGLVPEIQKIAAYAQNSSVTRRDIDAVADPVLSAEAFRMADAAAQGDYDRAAAVLGDLLKMRTETGLILGSLSSQMRRLYTACIAMENGKDRYWLMNLWGMRSDYGARILLQAAGKTNKEWCAEAVRLCQDLDLRIKSEVGIDETGELKLLLMRLGAKR